MTMSVLAPPAQTPIERGGYQGRIPRLAPGRGHAEASPYQAAGPCRGIRSPPVGPRCGHRGSTGCPLLAGGGVGAAPDSLSGALAADQHGIWEDPSLSLTFRQLYSADVISVWFPST